MTIRGRNSSYTSMVSHSMSAPLKQNRLRQSLSGKNAARREQLSAAAASAVPVSTRNDLLPRLELVHVNPAILQIPKRNVRQADTVHIREVAAAISAFGFCDPPLIDEKMNVLDGVTRVEAAKL